MPLVAPTIMQFQRRKNQIITATSWALEIMDIPKTGKYHILFAKRVRGSFFVLCAVEDGESLRSQMVLVPKGTKSGDRLRVTKVNGHRIWTAFDPEIPEEGWPKR